jgi:uncharacterized membrane protein (DUF4010 family)
MPMPGHCLFPPRARQRTLTRMDTLDTFQRLGLATALGLLVGLQREHAGTSLAGVRTFPLFTLLGTLCALLTPAYGTWLVAAGLLAVCALLVTANAVQRGAHGDGGGLTTEIAALVMYTLGAYLVEGRMVVAVVVAGALAVLLHLKAPLHDFIKRIDAKDIRAVMQFVLLSLVILPLVPDRTYGPYGVLNPRNIWWMVVLVVGVQLASYALYRLTGPGAGTLLGGILGGLVSSTATTVAYARRTRESPDAAPLAATVIMLASTVSLLRVLVVAALIVPQAVGALAAPLGAMLAALVTLSLAQFALVGRAAVQLPAAGNPAELKPALAFALLYALVTLGIAAAQDWLGHTGVFLVALVSGLTDMDAVTLSTSRLLAQGHLAADAAWRVILVAALANLVFKGGAAQVLGGWALGRRVLLLFGIAVACGLLLLWLWPAADLPVP